jgi:ferritin-like metal-binding protein YciE
MSQSKQLVKQLLAEAHGAETALIQTLGAHISMTPPGDYRRGLETHLRETRGHADKIQRRLDELGFRKNPLQIGHAFAQNILKNTMSIAKAPIDMVRGKSLEEKLVRNARDEAVTEALEIATYDTIETVALSIGDHETAQLAATIRADEEKMLTSLREIIPTLAGGLVREQVPPTERSVTSADELAIANYDDLTVDDIVGKLSGLSQEELRRIEQYEAKNSNRATVLKKIEGLKTQEPWPGYDGLTVAEIKDELQHAPAGRITKVRDYERTHKNRRSVIDLTERETANL